MAEASYLWDNPGTGDSPAPGYGNALLCQVIFRMLFDGTGNQGVLRLWENELEVTDGGVDTATVDTGAAFTYGGWYENDAAAVNVNINAFRGGNCLIVVRAVWATQTARIVARAVGALTQNPGATYEIPLANIAINGAGAITLITDTRDFCEFSTIMPDGVVVADNLQADSVTIGKLIDQDRWFSRGAGQFEADATNPAAWSDPSASPNNQWEFTNGNDEYMWCAFRVPADITGANITVYIYDTAVAGTGDVRWTYNLFQAAAAGVLANAAGAVVVSYAAGNPTYISPNYTLLITRAAAAGDIVHVRIGREGTHVTDTLAQPATIYQIRINYTADS